MDIDLFLGSHELIGAVCRYAADVPSGDVPVQEVISEVGWVADDVQLGLERLGRAGLLEWAGESDSCDRLVRLTERGLRYWSGDFHPSIRPPS